MKAFSEREIGRDVIEVIGYDINSCNPLWCTLGEIGPENLNNSATFSNGYALYRFSSDQFISSVIITTTNSDEIYINVGHI